MSENTSVILIQASNIVANDLKEVIKDKGFVFPINETWTALTIKNGLKKGKSCSKTLSQHFNTSVLTYDYNEDYFWHVALFQEGKEQASILMDFEEDEVRVLNSKLLCEVLFTQEQFESFIAQINEEDYPGAIESFKEMMWFDKVEWLSYEYLEAWDSQDYEKWGVTFLHRKTIKKRSFNNLVFNAYHDFLINSGFYLSEYTLEGNIYYNKLINGYLYNIIISTLSKNELSLSCNLPFFGESIQKKGIEQNVILRFGYKTKKELEQLINSEIKEFIARAIKYIEENVIFIQTGSLYDETSDNLLEVLGFTKIYVDKDIEHGGEAKYSNGEVELTFVHPLGYACIDKVYILNLQTGNQVHFISLIHNNRSYFEFDDTVHDFSFRTAEEFHLKFKHLISLIQKYLNERNYQFNL